MVPGSDRPSQRVSPHQRENSLRTVGMTPQAYYKKKKTLVSRRQIQDTMLSFVQYYRSKDPGIGGLKLYNELCSVYGSGLIGGRDAFLNLLRSRHLMLPPKSRGIRRIPTICTRNIRI